jgi:hypothetical protein
MNWCSWTIRVILDGVMVILLAIGPKVWSSNPTKGDGFLRAIKIHKTTVLGRK